MENHKGAYRATEQEIKDMFRIQFIRPSAGVWASDRSEEIKLKNFEDVDNVGKKVAFRDLGLKFAGASAYSLRGWWWFNQAANGGEDEHAVIWVTGNNQARFGRGQRWEDSIFVIYLTRRDLRVCSYRIGFNGNDSGEKSICQVQLLDGVRGDLWWIYTYMSYNRVTRTWYLLVQIDG